MTKNVVQNKKTTSSTTPKKLPRSGVVDTLNDTKEASRLKSKEALVADRHFDNNHAGSNRGK